MEAIYVKIIDEDIDVWKPAKAECIKDDIYKIIDTDDELEFNNGSIVQVKKKIFSDGEEGLIAYRKINKSVG
jgi:hypothetical protein